MDRACPAHEQRSEPAHCPNLDTGGGEEKRAAERDLEKDCGRREAEDGF